jgi:hypothetical protein
MAEASPNGLVNKLVRRMFTTRFSSRECLGLGLSRRTDKHQSPLHVAASYGGRFSIAGTAIWAVATVRHVHGAR